jgi:hypothetical protein
MPDAKKMGRPPKLGDHRTFTLRMPTDLHRQLRHVALDRGVSMNDLLVEVIQGWWAEQPERPTYAKPKPTKDTRASRKSPGA